MSEPLIALIVVGNFFFLLFVGVSLGQVKKPGELSPFYALATLLIYFGSMMYMLNKLGVLQGVQQ